MLVYEKDRPRKTNLIYHTVEEVEEALRICKGYTSHAARRLGMTARGIRQRIQRDPRLQKILEEIREESLDDTELALHNQIQKGNIAAIIWKLKCHGRHRGWVERDDFKAPVTDPVMQPPTIVVNFITPGFKKAAESIDPPQH